MNHPQILGFFIMKNLASLHSWKVSPTRRGSCVHVLLWAVPLRLPGNCSTFTSTHPNAAAGCEEGEALGAAPAGENPAQLVLKWDGGAGAELASQPMKPKSSAQAFLLG